LFPDPYEIQKLTLWAERKRSVYWT